MVLDEVRCNFSKDLLIATSGENFISILPYLAPLALKKFDSKVEVWQNNGFWHLPQGCLFHLKMLSVRSLFLDSCSLVKGFGNHKALGVFALRGQVADCSVTHTVSSCVLWTEFISSLWCIAGMSSQLWKENLSIEITSLFLNFCSLDFPTKH